MTMHGRPPFFLSAPSTPATTTERRQSLGHSWIGWQHKNLPSSRLLACPFPVDWPRRDIVNKEIDFAWGILIDHASRLRCLGLASFVVVLPAIIHTSQSTFVVSSISRCSTTICVSAATRNYSYSHHNRYLPFLPSPARRMSMLPMPNERKCHEAR